MINPSLAIFFLCVKRRFNILKIPEKIMKKINLYVTFLDSTILEAQQKILKLHGYIGPICYVLK